MIDNPDQQVCYFNKQHDDIFFIVFISKRIKAENFDQGIYFKIEKVRRNTEKESFDAKKTLEDGTGDVKLSKIFTISNQPEQRGEGKRTLMSTFSEETENQQDLNFFQDNSDIPKKKKNK